MEVRGGGALGGHAPIPGPRGKIYVRSKLLGHEEPAPMDDRGHVARLIFGLEQLQVCRELIADGSPGKARAEPPPLPRSVRAQSASSLSSFRARLRFRPCGGKTPSAPRSVSVAECA